MRDKDIAEVHDHMIIHEMRVQHLHQQGIHPRSIERAHVATARGDAIQGQERILYHNNVAHKVVQHAGQRQRGGGLAQRYQDGILVLGTGRVQSSGGAAGDAAHVVVVRAAQRQQ